EDRFAVGAERLLVDVSIMPQLLAPLSPGGDVPEPHRADPEGQRRPTVGAEDHFRYRFAKLQRRRHGRARSVVSGPRPPRTAAGEDRFAVGAERHGFDPPLIRQWLAELPPGRDVPEPRRPVIVHSEGGLAVGAEDHFRCPDTLMSQRRAELPPGGDVPEPR